MKIDVSRIVKSEGTAISIVADVLIDFIVFNGQEYKLSSPVKVDGTLRNSDGNLSLEAHAVAQFSTLCARCLEQIERTFEFDINEVFADAPIDDDSEFLPIVSNTIDLAVAVEDNFCTALPIRFLCSDDCRGLCHICGINLNKSTCSCDTEEIDPRLAKLKDFLKND